MPSGSDTGATAKRRPGPTTAARAYLEAIDAHDLDAAAALWRPGSIDRIVGMAEFTVPDGMREWFGTLFAAFPDFRIEVLSITAQKRNAAARYRVTGTFDGTAKFEGLTPNGAAVDIEGFDLFTVEDGLIVDNRGYLNGADLARQLGALPPAGSIAERGMTAALNARTAAGELVGSIRERAGTARSPRA
ncbi:MAG: ester cyclase [Solirubrobacterales bacterium]|nr:ester cyclase [Solirubrobacterales bacterium]